MSMFMSLKSINSSLVILVLRVDAPPSVIGVVREPNYVIYVMKWHVIKWVRE